MSEEEVVEVTPEQVSQARGMGWRPEEEFRGDKAKWVDAKTYLDRAEHVLPIVKADRDKLRGELATTNASVQTLKQQMAAATAALEEYRESHEEDVKRRVEAAKADLRKELIQAKKDGNVEAEVEIQEAIQELNKPVPKVEPKPAPVADDGVDPAFRPILEAWAAENEWWGTDKEKTAYAEGQAVFLNKSGSGLKGREFLDKVSELVQAKYSEPKETSSRRETPSKVEGARTGASQASGGKSYADLPAEAKAACEKDASNPKLVGPNRVYKTAKEFQAYYAKEYFAQE